MNVTIGETKYRIIKELGSGCHSIAYLIHDDKDSPYTLKVNKRDHHKNILQKEFQTLQKLNHKSLPKVYQINNIIYKGNLKKGMVMEYIEGVNIYDFIFEEDECKIIIKQLIEVVKYLLKNNIYHGDIKADNIMYNLNTTKMTLLDFSLAKDSSKLIPKKKITSEETYRAAEVYLEDYDAEKALVFSIAILIADMFFEPVDELFKSRQDIENGNILFPKDIPVKMKDMLIKMTHFDPKDRITIEHLEKDAWFKLTNGNKKIKN